jgi:hypothetical protein
MKKNKTTRSTKKSYSSVKEILKDNNSKIKLTPFNCKEAKFGKILTISNPSSLDGKFDVIFRRASTSEKFFGDMEKQRPNQILWNEEEQQAYFLNPDKQLYKILFEPVTIENQRSKQQIKNIAIRWGEFFDENAKWYNEKYKKYLLTSMFVDLLDIVKQKSIKVKCGIAMMELIEGYVYYVHCSPNKSIRIGGCEIIPELDFNLAKHDLWYEDICLVGTSVPEKDTNITQDANELFKKVAEKVCPPKKKKSLLERIFG